MGVQRALPQEEAGEERLPEREALWGSSGRFLKRRLAKSGFQSGGALWGSSGRFLKRGLPGRLAPNNFRIRGALWGYS